MENHNEAASLQHSGFPNNFYYSILVEYYSIITPLISEQHKGEPVVQLHLMP